MVSLVHKNSVTKHLAEQLGRSVDADCGGAYIDRNSQDLGREMSMQSVYELCAFMRGQNLGISAFSPSSLICTNNYETFMCVVRSYSAATYD